MDIREYVAEKGITVTVERDRGAQVDDNDPGGWEHHAYVLALHNATTGETWSGVAWKQGYGIETVPQDEPAMVLDALVSDAESVERVDSFEEWAEELGYSGDSLSAYRTYEQCKQIRDSLSQFVGDDFDHLLYDVDRL